MTPVVSRWAAYDPAAQSGPLPPDLAVRAALPADCPAIAAIEAERDGFDPRAARERCESEIGEPARLVLVAVVGGTVVGFGRAGRLEAGADPGPHSLRTGWYLLGVVVVDAWRRRGIARELTTRRLAWIAERSDRAYYFVNARNKASLDLHRRIGFREVTRELTGAGLSFEGGHGVLCELRLRGEPTP